LITSAILVVLCVWYCYPLTVSTHLKSFINIPVIKWTAPRITLGKLDFSTVVTCRDLDIKKAALINCMHIVLVVYRVVARMSKEGLVKWFRNGVFVKELIVFSHSNCMDRDCFVRRVNYVRTYHKCSARNRLRLPTNN
jgi:hypothetical protein